jgi:signal peptidase
MEDDPKTIRTKGDANPASIPGTDFPITNEEYIGKVAYTLPQVGYITQLLKPPINYVIIAVVIGIMVIKQFVKKKNEKELTFTDPLDSVNPDTIEELSDIDKIEKDSEYSEHVEKIEDIEELDDTDEPENQTKTEVIDETFEDIENSIDDKVESKEKDDSKKKEN